MLLRLAGFEISFMRGHRTTGPAAAVADGLRALIALGFIIFNFMPQRLQLSNRTERLATEVVPALRKMT
jgi:hypothetical protein